MPNIPSAIKELRKRDKLTRHNIAMKKAIKEEVKKVEKLLGEKKNEEAKKHAQALQKNVDKAAKKNVIEQNKANRMKSRIAKKIKGQ